MPSFPSSRRLTFKNYALLGLIAFLLALPGRMALPPLDRDEPRYMEASEQMILSGNYLDIRFQETPRYLQPAGIYWLEASSARATAALAGPRALRWAWPYRLPSLMAASAIVPLTAWIGCAFFGAEAGVLAAFFLMASTLFVAECRMATIDTVLLLDILCVEALLTRCYQATLESRAVPLKLALGYWVALGAGLMLKGPIVLIPALATPLAVGLTERNFRLWRSLRPSWGWLASLAIVAPWCIGIALASHGAFFRTAVGHNLLGKITHAQETHGFPPGYYLLLFGLTFWPGAWFTARALPQIWARRMTPPVRFLLCWIVPVWLFFECLATKLPHYTLPVFPAIAILTAASLVCWPAPRLPGWGRFLLGGYGVLWAAVGLAFCGAGALLLARLGLAVPPAEYLAFAGALVPMLGAIWFILHRRALAGAICAIGCALVAQTSLFFAVVPALDFIQLSPRAAASFAHYRRCPQSVLLSASDHEPSLVFLSGPKTQLLTPENAARALQAHAACDLALVDKRDEKRFEETLAPFGLEAVLYDRLTGLNYSNGHWLDLGLYAARPQKPSAAP